MPEKDFRGLAALLLGNARSLVFAWLPGGKIIGHEYACSSRLGGKGESFSVNLNTGEWGEFNNPTAPKGRDLISLYAEIHQIKNGEAFDRLSTENAFQPQANEAPNIPPTIEVTQPPEGVTPVLIHWIYGKPVKFWTYVDIDGRPLFYIARYMDKDGKKQIVPWSWHPGQAKFIQKGWPSPRPLLGLDDLANRPDAPVLLVEGEPARDGGRALAGDTYVVMTWPNGVAGVNKADWSVLQGRKVLIWPDADRKLMPDGRVKKLEEQPGTAAALAIAENLRDLAQEIKIIDVGIPEEDTGWDAADAVAAGWNWDAFYAWAVPRAYLWPRQIAPRPDSQSIANQAPAEVVAPQPEPPTARIEVSEDMGEVPASMFAAWETIGVAQTKAGVPICNFDNVLRVLEGWPGLQDIIWFDEFHQKYFRKGGAEWRDVDDLNVLIFMQRELGLRKVSLDMVRNALQTYAHQRPRNEPRDWMDTMVWDKTERLDAFFPHYFGVRLSDYSMAASKNWWIAMVARIYAPGSKVDNMVILEGGQGRYKSTSLDIIGGKWYAETHESVMSKDFYLQLQGKMICEISELDTFSRVEVSTIKKVITCRTDRFRPPYGRASADFPRRSIFVGTTNESTYLRDTTGARRFWPMKIKTIKIDDLRRDRDQLFAEAVHRFKQGEPWYLMPDGETSTEQESRRQHDEWEGPISKFLVNTQETTLQSVAHEVGISLGELKMAEQRRITNIMTILKWESHPVRGADGVIERIWKPKPTEGR